MPNKKKSSTASKLASSVKQFDSFGQGVSFDVGGGATFNSFKGAFLSLAILFIVIFFAANGLSTMLDRGDTKF